MSMPTKSVMESPPHKPLFLITHGDPRKGPVEVLSTCLGDVLETELRALAVEQFDAGAALADLHVWALQPTSVAVTFTVKNKPEGT